MSEALKKLLTFAFEKNSVRKAFAVCQIENVKSENVMVKCGMYKSAEQPEQKVYNGVLKERLKYELTSDNYFRV
jgi:ribosomal-protein-alanine N-acetyltransferase